MASLRYERGMGGGGGDIGSYAPCSLLLIVFQFLLGQRSRLSCCCFTYGCKVKNSTSSLFLSLSFHSRATTVNDIMTRNPMCVTADTSAQDALNLMVSRGFRHLVSQVTLRRGRARSFYSRSSIVSHTFNYSPFVMRKATFSACWISPNVCTKH